MKVVIIAEDGDLIREVVEKEGHTVMAQSTKPDQMMTLIVEHTPHFVFLERTDQLEADVISLQALFATVRFVLLGFERGTSWTKTIRQALRKQRINLPWQATEPEQRRVVFDPRYYSLSNPQKRKRPTEDDDDATQVEASRFLLMLRTARQTRPRAEAYREAMGKVMGYEWQEIVYRTTHDSFKSPAYARDLLSRSLGYLCHFVPGVDLDGLTNPVDQPAEFKYLHYFCPPEMKYALFALALYGFNESLAKHLYHAALWKFSKESDEDLAGTSLLMTGLSFTMHRVGWAQSTTINWLLDPQTPSRLEAHRDRALHRAIQTFTDWWGFRRVIDDTTRLKAVLDDLHDSKTDSPVPDELLIPDFANFIKAMQAQAHNHNNQP